MTMYSPTTAITDDRIKSLEEQGRRARRECRSRVGVSMYKIERTAFQRGWDEVNNAESMMFQK